MADLREFLKSEAMRDVISILDTAFLSGNELHAGFRGMQVANRALIAHIGIERGLKDGLEKAGLSYPRNAREGHDLPHLYGLTKQIDGGNWSAVLAEAFDDAVAFYEYDLELVPHVATLEKYFEATGTSQDFMQMRYWLEDSSSIDDSSSPAPLVMLHLHKEILEALWPLFAYDQKRLVSMRVENVVANAVMYVLGYAEGTPEEQASKELQQWLKTKPSFRHALKEAVQNGYIVAGVGELGGQKLQQAFESLRAQSSTSPYRSPSADPAVAFYVTTCLDLPAGYQPKYPDAQVSIRWLHESQIIAEVLSPAGEPLGHIRKHINSRWFGAPYIKQAIFNKDFEDVKRLMVDQQCEPVIVTPEGQAAKKLYVYSADHSFSSIGVRTYSGWSSDPDCPQEFEVRFWDLNHYLMSGQPVKITSKLGEESPYRMRLDGTVSKVAAHKVWISGRGMFDLAEK